MSNLVYIPLYFVDRSIADWEGLFFILQNTWNSFACNMNETVVLDAARRIVELGFKDLGYNYVVLDDCWSAGRNSSGYLVPDKKKFPSGIADVANKIHDMGLKIGIYSSAGTMTCGHYAGSLGYEKKDAEVWASWGVSLFVSHTQCLIIECFFFSSLLLLRALYSTSIFTDQN